MAISKSMRFISLAFLFTLIFAMVLMTPGCGSGSGDRASPEKLAEIEERRKKKDEKEAIEHKKKLAVKKKESEKKRREAKKRKAKAEAKRRRLHNKSHATEHPALCKDWTDKDFYIAKVEQDRRLTEAVEYLADYCEDSDRAVRLLRELITPSTPLTKEELGEIGVRRNYKYDKQVKSLLQALIARDTDESIKLVEKIVSGEIATDAKGVAIPASLQAIAESPTERNEPIFFDALREQPEASGKLLQTIIARGASESFRLTLAEYSLASTSPERQCQAIQDILCKGDPRNLPAMLLLYRDDRLPESYRKILERQFAVLSQAAVRQVCGFPSEMKNKASKKQRGSVKKRQAPSRRTSGIQGQLAIDFIEGVDEAELLKLVKTNLWNDEFATLLAKRLYQVDSLEEDKQLILLAMNTPHNEPRKMLVDLFLRNWQETPAKLSSIGFPEKVVVEPGFWIVAKRLLSESGATEKGAVRKKGKRNRARANRGEGVVDPVQRAWQEAFGKMLVTMCGRLEAAGRPVYSQDEITGVSTSTAKGPQQSLLAPSPATGFAVLPVAGDRANFKGANSKNSVKAKASSEVPTEIFSVQSLLHSNARPVTEYKFQMPNDSFSVHYLRCEELAQPEAVLKHYRGKLNGASELSGPRLCWLGAFVEEKSAEGERFHSADVLLRIEQPGAAGNRSAKLELSIEILLISIKHLRTDLIH